MNYPTPHIKATPEDFGKTVLMPGDPLRAKFIAENFLEDAKLVNNVRGIHGYTGFYKGKKISSEVVKVISAILHTEDLWKAFTIEEKGEKSMVKALEELINRGKEEERRTIIRSMIQNGLGEEEIMKYTGSTMELVVQVRESL